MPIKLNSTGGGSVTLDVPSMSSANTLTLPAKTGNIITSADSGTVTPAMISTGGPSWDTGGNTTISGILTASLTGSLATSGYTKLPNGLYIQWGSISLSDGTVTFPITFPNSLYTVTVGCSNVNWIGLSSLTTASFYVTQRTNVSGYAAASGQVYWMAIGR